MTRPLFLAALLLLPGCAWLATPTGKAVEGVALSLAEGLCEAYLPRVMATGASLVCKGAQGAIGAIEAAVAAGVAAPPATSPSPLGGGGASEPVRTPRGLRLSGQLVAIVPLTAEEQRVAQAHLDARPRPEVSAGPWDAGTEAGR